MVMEVETLEGETVMGEVMGVMKGVMMTTLLILMKGMMEIKVVSLG